MLWARDQAVGRHGALAASGEADVKKKLCSPCTLMAGWSGTVPATITSSPNGSPSGSNAVMNPPRMSSGLAVTGPARAVFDLATLQLASHRGSPSQATDM